VTPGIPVLHLVMVPFVLKRVLHGNLGCPDKLGMVPGNIVNDPWAVVLDQGLDLFAGTGVDDRIGPVLCEPFHNRIVREVKRGYEQERRDILAIQVAEKFFLVRDLDLELLEVRRRGDDLGKCDMVVRIHQQHVELGKILAVAPDRDITILGVKEPVLTKPDVFAPVRCIGAFHGKEADRIRLL
jgi:hypothetical protein